jgi:type II secretory pathway component PulK
MSSIVHNERGMALVMTLLVVALLTIIVTEFAFSAHVDQRMTRNSLYSLQASLLARSGINMGEALLLADQERNFDAYVEDWGKLGRSDDLDAQLIVPDNMRLKVKIEDEMGKLNLNLTRPANANECKTYADKPPTARYRMWLTALQRIAPDVSTIVDNYWSAICDGVNSLPQPQATGAPARTPTPTPGAAAAPTVEPTQSSDQDWNALLRYDFPTLDDAAAQMGIPNSFVQHLRRVVTALPTSRVVAQRSGVNVNTAPLIVLQAICSDGDAAHDVYTRARENGIMAAEVGQLCSAPPAQQGEATTNPGQMFVATSQFFNIRASAVVNCDPTTGRGGVRRTASMLVQRFPAAGAPPAGGQAQQVRWTLTQLDWQKEGGAALFTEKPDDDLGDAPESDLAPMGG